MEVYRISLNKYAKSLQASGRPARWNGKGYYMLYSAGSAALACLENLAHRSGVDLSMANFSITTLNIPDTLKIKQVPEEALRSIRREWYKASQYSMTQEIGNKWIDSGESAVLQVPSAIIQTESNFLINVEHPDALKIKIVRSVPFLFDQRLFSL